MKKTYFVYVKIKVLPWSDWFLTGFWIDHESGDDLYGDMLAEADKRFKVCHAHEVYAYSEDKKLLT